MQRFLPPAAPTQSQLHAAESLISLKHSAAPLLAPPLAWPFPGPAQPVAFPSPMPVASPFMFDAASFFAAGCSAMLLPPLFPLLVCKL